MNPHSVLDTAGPQAAHIARLWWLMFWITTAVSVIVLAFLWRAIARTGGEPSRERGDRATADRTLTRAVAASVALTVLILFVLLVSSVWTGRVVASLGASSALTISITGHQWWWEVEYEDEVASRRVTTANEIHVPTGRPIALKVTSRDVIHSFWVPNLNGKRDLIPGYTTAIWIQADRVGVYRGQCAEFCGRQHANMALTLVAESQGEFDHWLGAERQSAREPETDVERRGREVLETRQCSVCHTVRGTAAQGRVGPDLTHLAARRTIAAATLPNTRGHLAGWILDPQTIKPGNQMPPNFLVAEELEALLAYLEHLK